MKKVIKVAGYQGDSSVHTRSMDFFINILSKTFDFEYEKDITLTSTDEILKVYKLDDPRPPLKEFQNKIQTPSGEPDVGSGNFTVKK